MLNIVTTELENYELFLNNFKIENNDEIINEVILPYPHFIATSKIKDNYPAILHSIWFKDKENKIYDLNLIFYLDEETKDFQLYIVMNDKLLHGESKSPELRINSCLNNSFFKNNKNTISKIMKEHLFKLGKKLLIENDTSYKGFSIKEKKEYEESSLVFVLKNKITKNKIDLYVSKMKQLYNKLYLTNLTEEKINNELFIYNEYFKNNEILNEKEIKKIKKPKKNLEGMLERNSFKNRQLLVVGWKTWCW